MIVLRALRRLFLGTPRRLFLGTAFLLYFLREMVLANLVVAYEVVTPTHYMRPAIVEVPLKAKTDLEIVLLANLISLTPGTLTIEIAPDRRALYVHGMHVFTTDDLREKIGRLEGRLLRVLR